MYGYYGSNTIEVDGLSDLTNALSGQQALNNVMILIIIAVAIVNLIAIKYFVRIAAQKQSDISSGVLWLIGLFTPFVVLPLLVVAMPDRSKRNN